jgi:hypothetical protein
MWNVKTRVIPVIICAIGTISKSFRKYVTTIPGNQDIRVAAAVATVATVVVVVVITGPKKNCKK